MNIAASNDTAADNARYLAQERLANDTTPRTGNEHIARYSAAFNAATHLKMLVQSHKETKR